MASGVTSRLLSSKRAPVFMPVDFFRFMDVLCRWVALVQQQAANDVQLAQLLAADPSYLQMDLTLQEFTILIRNSVMNAFKHQYFVQGSAPGYMNLDTFVPFVSGMGTYPVRTTEPLLPAFLVENVRCLTSKIQAGKNPTAFFPVLGQYGNIVLDEDDFSYHLVEDPTLLPSFIPAALASSDENGNPLVETQVRMYDGGAGANFYALNFPRALEDYANAYLAWVEKIRAFVGVLTGFASDGGLSCSSISMTATIFENQDADKGLTLTGRPVARVKHKRISRFVRDTPPGPYDNYENLVVAYNYAPLSSVYGMLDSAWIHPQFQLFVGQMEDQLVIAKFQIMTRCPYAITQTINDDNPSFSQLNHQYALKMVKARNGEDLQCDRDIIEAARLGRGGMITGLIGKMLGVPSAITDLLPV
jgi:hypothetical protein